jgi:alpha-N-arabinofuranosidase
VGNRAPADPAFEGEGEIWLQEIDPATWQLLGERHALWRGACGGTWAEGPHIYKRDGRYYLLIAEGGTSFNHAVMVAVADTVTGPYQSNPRNPILTSRHLSYDHWVNSTGHADLFELPDGRWYAVLLGIRNETARRSNMGRETFLAPVSWEREPFEWKDVRYEWPVISPGTGRIERSYPAPLPDARQRPLTGLRDDFDAPALGPAWNFRRVPQPDSHSLSARPGFLRLHARAPIGPRGRASLAGIRQTASTFRLETRMLFEPGRDGSEAGLVLVQKDDHYLAFTLRRENGAMRVDATGRSGGAITHHAQRPVADYDGEIVLRVVAAQDGYRLGYVLPGADDAIEVARVPGDALLSRGYTGAYLGLYAAHEDGAGVDHADFDWLHYRPGTQ